MRRVLLIALLALWPASAPAGCRLALVLALDVSGSVDPVEYRQQLHGIAGALENDAVMGALLADPARPVALSVFEWSSGRFQRRLLPWSLLDDRRAIGLAAGRLRAFTRHPAPQMTGIGGALLAGQSALESGPVCDRRVIDLSGDGKNNDWPPPERIRDSGALIGTVVNGLVILPDRSGADPEGLAAYFRARILYGPGAFLETARGFSDYARAMTRKLLRETEAPRIGALPPGNERLAAR